MNRPLTDNFKSRDASASKKTVLVKPNYEDKAHLINTVEGAPGQDGNSGIMEVQLPAHPRVLQVEERAGRGSQVHLMTLRLPQVFYDQALSSLCR